jgi:hypothetical protein
MILPTSSSPLVHLLVNILPTPHQSSHPPQGFSHGLWKLLAVICVFVFKPIQGKNN